EVLRGTFTRRGALSAAAGVVGGGGTARLGKAATPPAHHQRGGGPAATLDPEGNGFDPARILRDLASGHTRPPARRRTRRRGELVAYDKEIEIIPGVKYAAWTYNGRVPGPTLRAREGDLLRIRFTNAGTHPHTIHFHGIHPAVMDGTPGVGPGEIPVGKEFTY